MIRRQRPLGLTLLLTSINTKTHLDEKTVYQLINYTMNHNLSYNNTPFTIETLSQLLGISLAQAYKYMLQHSSKVANLINPNDIQGLYRGTIFSILAKSSGTLSQIQNQRRILQTAQGNQYVAFLTEQVNSILSTEMAAMEKVAKISESLLKTIDPMALPQNPNGTEGEKAIGVNEALRLLESQGRLGLHYSKEEHNALKQTYLEDPLIPQVIANLQIGNKEDEALVKMNKKHHRERRSKEYGIDEEES